MSCTLSKPHVFAGLKKHFYRLIHLDPPTKFVAGSGGRPQHYRRMSDREIAALPLPDLMHPDGCWIAYWVNSPKLYRPMHSRKRLRPDEIADVWGARWSARGWIWLKLKRSVGENPLFISLSALHRGMGMTTGKNVEDCMLFRTGRAKIRTRKAFEPILAPVREHSRKPDEIYSQIELFCEGPYLDLFARGDGSQRPGWDYWGDELGKFAEAA